MDGDVSRTPRRRLRSDGHARPKSAKVDGEVTPDIPVYVIEVSGDFTIEDASVPKGQPAPTGTTLWFVETQSSWTLVGQGVVHAGRPLPFLQSLGTLEVDSVSGIAPSSISAWREEYHVPAKP